MGAFQETGDILISRQKTDSNLQISCNVLRRKFESQKRSQLLPANIQRISSSAMWSYTAFFAPLVLPPEKLKPCPTSRFPTNISLIFCADIMMVTEVSTVISTLGGSL